MNFFSKNDNPISNLYSSIKTKSGSLYSSFTPEQITLFVILVVAFTQGVVSLSDLSVQYLYKDDYQMTPAQVSITAGIIGLPWIVKPMWGLISDNIPIFGYRRKIYLMVCGTLSATCYFCLSSVTTIPFFGIALLFISSCCISFASVIGEALIVESAQSNNAKRDMLEEDKQAEASNNVSFFFGVKNIGVLITSYAGGWLLTFVSKYSVFFLTMMFPLFEGMCAILLPEKKFVPSASPRHEKPNMHSNGGTIEIVSEGIIRLPLEDSITPTTRSRSEDEGLIEQTSDKDRLMKNVESNWSKIITFIKNPCIYKPIIFIFIFSSTPSAGSAMFFFYTNKLGFSTEFMGEIQLASALASVTGIWIFNRWFRNVPFLKIFCWSAIICTLANLTQIMLVIGMNEKIGISNKFFCLTGNLIIQVFAELNIIPVLVLACRICPKNVEGTMYAFLMAILNFGSMLSNELGAFLTYILGITPTNFDRLWILILISSITIILPLPFVGVIDFEKAIKLNEEQNKLDSSEEERIKQTILEKSEDMIDDSTLCHGEYEKIQGIYETQKLNERRREENEMR